MTQPVELPEWIFTYVGRLSLENEMLRRALAEMQMASSQNGQVSVEEPVS
jgi:hypothetical protein